MILPKRETFIEEAQHDKGYIFVLVPQSFVVYLSSTEFKNQED